ncbi:hypothetical protein [Aquimarina sp. RZ0]|uniref:hypothetical protein n=1 Tax=Aquimarina sp. RZ0 TaxID=2607730 RepID=UPI0011F0F17F|nr:hypothetical protein [Aquimarina sp. RZ0]KAA1244844.1 hypothetical protein F0000_14670 [Aquimarina sp. RZ0]
MFKSIITSKKYWISVLLLGIVFILLFSLIEHFMEYGGLIFTAFKEEKLANGHWIRYLLSRLVGGFVYGAIMAYYFELRKRK